MMLLVRDIMRYNLGAVTQDMSLREAAELMKVRDATMLPVGDDGHMIGIITDRDIAMSVGADKLDPNLTPVGVVMEESVVVIFDDRDLVEAMQLMQFNKTERLVVLDRSTQAMLGVVTLGDIASRADLSHLHNDGIKSDEEEPLAE